MQYRLPKEEDEQELRAYVKEHYDNGEQGISASMGLPVSEYSDWLKKIHTNATDGDGEWGRSLCLLCVEGGKIVGLLSIRYELCKELSDKYGDIGYGVRPSERNKGYATEMLRYALTVCAEHGRDKVILGCYKDNLPSAAVIKKCNGALIAENENFEPGHISQYYEIRLTQQ